MRQRVNTLSHSQVDWLMRKLCAVQCELTKWQKHTLPHEEMPSKRTLQGDSGVMVELIGLRNLIVDIIDTSAKANKQ